MTEVASTATGAQQPHLPAMPFAASLARLFGARLVIRLPLFVAIALRFASAGATFLVTFLIARGFGAAVSGEYALFSQTIMTFGMIAVFGNEQLLVRRMAGFLAKERLDLARLSYSHAMRWVGRTGVALALLVLALSPWGRVIGIAPALLMIAAAGVLIQPLLLVSAAALRGAHRQIQGQSVQSLQQLVLVFLTLGVVFAWPGRPDVGLALAYFVALALAALVGVVTVRRLTRDWPRSPQKHPDEGRTSSVKLGLIIALDTATLWSALSISGALLGVADAGVFRVCMQFITVMAMLGTTVEQMMGPRFASLFSHGDFAGARRTLNRSVLFLVAAGGGPLVGMVLFAEPLLGLMGEEFRSGADTLRILALGQISVMAAGASGTMITMRAREAYSLKLAFFSFVVVIPALVLLVNRFGINGAALAIGLMWFIRNQGSHIFARRLLRAEIRGQAATAA